MSGHSWTPERRAAHAAAMRRRWKAGVYAKRRGQVLTEAERRARSRRMSNLNVRMRDDEKLKARCIRGQKRVRRSAAFRAIQVAVMRDIMARPEMRRRARFHAMRINKNPETRKRQWATRRKQAKAGAS